ncbi:uncharacterized protein LODBEIA_P17490 [Lodderomyces beijingensis]|uniref:NADH:flavin oxidoreductase/NADH oxidase N-terminal domain-containing protein n=1 Tax=Lodderomyces beijingensis TaxID=1775926 RepID=A0ABP0ZH93_9ASCO
MTIENQSSYEDSPSYVVKGAPQVPYYTPQQPIPAGTFLENTASPQAPPPAIFTPIKVGPLELHNRIGVSPMCQYSANDNFEATPYHLIHYGSLVTRGPGITIVESTAVSRLGPLSPHDLGIWTPEQARALKPVVEYAHSQGQKIAIQLGHGGRKASGQPPFVHLEQVVDASSGGWPDDVVAPSSIAFRPHGNYRTPHELTTEEIKQIIKDFGDAAQRAVEIAGFDALEIHGAHGYLINEFYSPISNHRSDEYGGSFENRIRFLSEIIDEIKSKVDTGKVSLFVRISAAENSPDPNAWTIQDSIRLADVLISKGISLVDVSSGGNDSKQAARGNIAKEEREPMHVPLARAIKKHVGDKLVVACVGQLDDAVQVNKYIEDGTFDVALIGRGFLRDPGLVWSFADTLGVKLAQALQLGWGFWPPKQSIIDLIQRTEKLNAGE